MNFRKLIEWLQSPCLKVCRMGDDVCKLDCCRLDCKIRGKPSACCHCDSGHFCVECCSGRTDSLLAHTEKKPFVINMKCEILRILIKRSGCCISPPHEVEDKTFQLVPISPNLLQLDLQSSHDLFYQPCVIQPKS